MHIWYKHEDICSGAGYTEIIDSRLKTNSICAAFYEKAAPEKASANALVSMLLADSNAEYPSITTLSRHLSSLYGSSVRAGTSKLGDYQVMTVSASCIADRFTINGENISDSLTDTFIGCLYEPHLVNGVFEEKEFRLKKNELLDEIDAEINDKRAYAFRKASEIIFRGEPASVPANGRRSDAEKLTPEEVYKRYCSLLETARVELIFVGPGISPDNKRKLCEAVSSVNRNYSGGTYRAISPAKSEPEYSTDRLDIAQSKMVMAFKSGYENVPAMNVFSAVYGGTPFSKLFVNVREKMSLCYYCSSGFNEKKGTLFVDSGIEHGNIEPARAEILNQLEQLKKGDISDEELANAKLAKINSLRGVNDSPSAMIRWHINKLLNDGIVTPESEIEKVRAVTKEDIIEAANSLVPDTVYVLTGKEEK